MSKTFATRGIDPKEAKKLTQNKQYKYNNFCKPINPMCLTLLNWNWNYSATFTSPNAQHHPCPWAGQLRTLNRLGPQNLASLQVVLRYTQHAPTSSSNLINSRLLLFFTERYSWWLAFRWLRWCHRWRLPLFAVKSVAGGKHSQNHGLLILLVFIFLFGEDWQKHKRSELVEPTLLIT